MIEIPSANFQMLVKIKNEVKENLTIFIIIPTILGGLVQAIQLLVISPSLLRFFSLSQLVVDGLFILLYFVIIVVLPLYSAKQIMQNVNNLSRKGYNILNTLLISVQIINMSANVYYYKLIASNSFLDFILQLLLFFIFGCSIFLPFKNNQNEPTSLGLQKTNWSMGMFIFIMGIILSLIMFKKINDSIPIDNFKVLEKKYGNVEKIEILYFNDKYIFIEIKNKKSKNKIHIEKLEVIFLD